MKIEGHLNIIEQEVKSLRVRLKNSVEVVRCKDCKHYWRNSEDVDGVAVCLASPKDDAFCSEGERRDDE